MKPIIDAINHSVLVYDNPKNKNESEILSDALEFIPLSINTDYAYFALYKDRAVFSYAGSDDFGDWIDNLRMIPGGNDSILNYDGKKIGLIHNGFYKQWVQFKPIVNDIVSNYQLASRNIPIRTYGHSLGGTEAELCSRHLFKNLKIPSSCITFGCPGIGTSEYRDEFRSMAINGTRVINGSDIVPSLPPFLKHGCANKVWIRNPLWKRLLPWNMASDHYQRNYKKAVVKQYNG